MTHECTIFNGSRLRSAGGLVTTAATVVKFGSHDASIYHVGSSCLFQLIHHFIVAFPKENMPAFTLPYPPPPFCRSHCHFLIFSGSLFLQLLLLHPFPLCCWPLCFRKGISLCKPLTVNKTRQAPHSTMVMYSTQTLCTQI